MASPTISALVVAHDEETQIADCLDRLAFADEIVVVLDRCTDRTGEIAASFGARTIEGAWPIEGDRRNTGIDACKSQWVLEVDADERVTEALAAEMRQAIRDKSVDWYHVPYDNYIGNRLVRYGWGAAWGVSSSVRLFRKPVKRWGRERIHPRVTLKGNGGRLNARMIHYVDQNISDMLQRLDRYTTARAADLRDKGDIGSYGHNIRRMFSRFWKCYVGRKGYREGQYGFVVALMAGLYPILSYLKAKLEGE
jgi:glycosyltransferase involved in cell wall biosynthesis